MDTTSVRLQTLTTDHHTHAQHRPLSICDAWRALDDDPVLLCECGDDRCSNPARPTATSETAPG